MWGHGCFPKVGYQKGVGGGRRGLASKVCYRLKGKTEGLHPFSLVSLSFPLLLFLPLRLSQGVFVCLILFRVLPSVAGVIIAAHMLSGL